MWLLPVFHKIASASMRIYYRAGRAGHSVPSDGPVLLVANHPNSLMDPAAVWYGARRPVRFLSKADLFDHPVVGWLVRASGSIPVYRREDDPTQMGRNAQMFEAVHASLAQGSAVALFPEGRSHDEPSMVELRTGAARIALGASAIMGGRDFPIVPVGLVFRKKHLFRSRARVIVGRQIHWRDLAGRAESDAEAVRTLTKRIDAALREITVNLEEWEDAPIVELAEAVYAAEFDLRDDPVEQVARLRETTEVLARLRERGDGRWRDIAGELKKHARLLQWFHLTPRALRASPKASAAIGWSMRRFPLALVGASGIWVAGSLLFWLPYRVTGMIGKGARKSGPVLVSTTHLVGGAVVFGVWIILLSLAAGFIWGVRAALVALVGLPVLALTTMFVREGLRGALREAMNFFRLSRGKRVLDELRNRQRSLAQRLDDLWKSERAVTV